MTQVLNIVGGGMAGSEAAWQAAKMGVQVVIHEMRPKVETFAHQNWRSGGNGLFPIRSGPMTANKNAVGLLHWEMRAAGGLIMEMADAHYSACRWSLGG